MNSIIQKIDRANQTWIKLRAKIFPIFCIANYASKNLQKSTNVSSIGKNNPDFIQNCPTISLAKKKQKTNMVKSAITHLKWRIMIWKFGKIISCSTFSIWSMQNLIWFQDRFHMETRLCLLVVFLYFVSSNSFEFLKF